MPGDIKGLSMEILKKTITDVDKYQVGLTKIFFRPGMVQYFLWIWSNVVVGISREIKDRPIAWGCDLHAEELAAKHVS